MLNHIRCSEKPTRETYLLDFLFNFLFIFYSIKLLNVLRVGFSHLREHKFRVNFADTLNPFYAYALETACIEHDFSTLPELHLIPSDPYQQVT